MIVLQGGSCEKGITRTKSSSSVPQWTAQNGKWWSGLQFKAFLAQILPLSLSLVIFWLCLFDSFPRTWGRIVAPSHRTVSRIEQIDIYKGTFNYICNWHGHTSMCYICEVKHLKCFVLLPEPKCGLFSGHFTHTCGFSLCTAERLTLKYLSALRQSRPLSFTWSLPIFTVWYKEHLFLFPRVNITEKDPSGWPFGIILNKPHIQSTGDHIWWHPNGLH